MTSGPLPDLDYLASLTAVEFDRSMLSVPTDLHMEVAAAYARHISSRLGNEADAALHLEKWLSIGGGTMPADLSIRTLQRLRPAGRSRSEVVIAARQSLERLVEAITDDRLVWLMVQSSDRDIPFALESLARILHGANFAATERKPGQIPSESLFAASKAAVDFFPADYPTAKAARAFVIAWQSLEEKDDAAPRSNLNIDSVRVTMQRAKGKRDASDFSDRFNKWRSGKV